jgi:hypothetical protein
MHLHYQQEVYRKLFERLPLGAYLPRAPGPHYPVISEADRSKALIHRGCMLLAHGLSDDALRDFAAGLRGFQAGKDRAMHLLLSKTMAVDPFRFRHRTRLITDLNRTFRTAGCSVLLPFLARGTYWSLRLAIKQRAWRQGITAAAMLVLELLLFGFRLRTSKSGSAI